MIIRILYRPATMSFKCKHVMEETMASMAFLLSVFEDIKKWRQYFKREVT